MAQQGSAELRKLVAKLRKVSAEGRQAVAVALQASANSLITRGFNRSQAPDGTPWAPIVHREGQPLNHNGHLKGGWHDGPVSASGFSIDNNTVYAAVHQFGHTFLRQGRNGRFFLQTVTPRPMIPTEGLPAAWVSDFTKTATAALKRILSS
jgi:phage gpG-like protein